MAETGRSGESLEWRGRDCATIGKFGDTLCSIKTAEEAEDFWHTYVAWLERPGAGLCGKSAVDVASSNIGYLMGYYGREERQRVYGLFPAARHPIFGRFESEPTPEETFRAGEQMMRGES